MFLKTIQSYATLYDITLHCKGTADGKLTIMLVPKPKDSNEAVPFIPFVISGMPEEIDAHVPNEISKALTKSQGLVSNLAQFTAQENEAKAPLPKAKAKEEKVKESKEEKPKAAQTDIFSQPAEVKPEVKEVIATINKEAGAEVIKVAAEAPAPAVSKTIDSYKPEVTTHGDNAPVEITNADIAPNDDFDAEAEIEAELHAAEEEGQVDEEVIDEDDLF